MNNKKNYEIEEDEENEEDEAFVECLIHYRIWDRQWKTPWLPEEFVRAVSC